MNYLAHLYLSAADDQSLLGNFLADFVTSHNDYHKYPAIARGIQHHIRIDRFTDTHAVFKKSLARVRQQVGRYSGIIVDMFYDHFLARDWSDYTEIPLEEFARRFYAILEKHKGLAGTRVNRLMPYLVKENWLVSYREIKGIHQSLSRLAYRARYKNCLCQASSVLQQYYAEFELDFKSFFLDLRSYSDSLLNNGHGGPVS